VQWELRDSNTSREGEYEVLAAVCAYVTSVKPHRCRQLRWLA